MTKKNEIAFVIRSLPNNLHVHKYIFTKLVTGYKY